MKILLVVIALLGSSLYFNQILANNPSEIEEPVYLKSHVSIEIPNISRDLEMVVLGEMVSESDCAKRSDKFLGEIFTKCPFCEVESTVCKSEIRSAYEDLFYDEAGDVSYLSLTRGSRYERSGRIVVWGLTDKESDIFCAEMKKQVSTEYQGSMECI